MDEPIDETNVKITFGLQPYHIAAIEREAQRWRDLPPLPAFPDAVINPLYMRYFWDVMGKELGWESFTLCLHYLEHLEDQKVKQVLYHQKIIP